MRATHISSTQHPSRPAWTDVFTAIKSLPALPLEENQLKDGSLDSNFTESAQRKVLRSPSFSQAAISMTAKWLRRFPSAWKAFLFVQRGCWFLRRIFEKTQRPCQPCWIRTVYLRRHKAEYEQTYFWWTMETSKNLFKVFSKEALRRSIWWIAVL